MTLTRRKLAGILAASPALAQTPAAPPSDMVKLAQENNRMAAESMKKVPLPMTTEPAFLFKA